MAQVTKTYHIEAPIKAVWQAMVDPKIIEKWSGAPAKMTDAVWSRFELWDGDIHGRNIEVVPEKRLTQEWYAGNWPEPSHVTFSLMDGEDEETIVELTHNDIPEEEIEEIDDGWDKEYMGKIKKYLEKKS